MKDLNVFGIFVHEKESKKQVVVVTKKGMIKRTLMSSFKARNKRVAPFISLSSQEDEVICLKISDADEKNTIILSTNRGTIHRFYEKGFSASNPGGSGVPCISTSITENENIVDFSIIKEGNEENKIIVLYIKDDDNYYIKGISVEEFKTKGRVSKGIIGAVFNKKEEVVKIKVTDSDFYILDKKGLVHKQKYISIPAQTRYNKPVPLDINVNITEFMIN